MKKLLEKIKTEKELAIFKKKLFEKVKQNSSISNNPMIDGVVIGFILTTGLADDLFLQEEIGVVLEGSLQKLEQIIIWCTNNEEKLCNMF